MRKSLLAAIALCGILALGLAGIAMANSAVDGDTPAMMVSPSVIILAKVSTVTIHTNIPAAAVDLDSIDLDGVEPTGLGVDSTGCLVAKFAIADLGLAPGSVTLTLNGAYEDGGTFSASDVVVVK